MTEGRIQSRMRAAVRTLLAVLVGMVIGAAINAALGEQGADTPAMAIYCGGLALVIEIVSQTRRRARERRRFTNPEVPD